MGDVGLVGQALQLNPNDEIADSESSYEFAKRLFLEGIEEFRAGGYFEAHDLWEEFWQELRGPDRVFVQALIHLAVGTYHHENGNTNGAHSQLRKAATKLAKYPTGHWGVTTADWLTWVEAVLAGQEATRPTGGLPFDQTQFPTTIPMAPR